MILPGKIARSIDADAAGTAIDRLDFTLLPEDFDHPDVIMRYARGDASNFPWMLTFSKSYEMLMLQWTERYINEHVLPRIQGYHTELSYVRWLQKPIESIPDGCQIGDFLSARENAEETDRRYEAAQQTFEYVAFSDMEDLNLQPILMHARLWCRVIDCVRSISFESDLDPTLDRLLTSIVHHRAYVLATDRVKPEYDGSGLVERAWMIMAKSLNIYEPAAYHVLMAARFLTDDFRNFTETREKEFAELIAG